MTKNKKMGNYKGRVPKYYKEYSDFERYYFEWKYKRITKIKMAKYLNVSRPTLDKLIKQYQERCY